MKEKPLIESGTQKVLSLAGETKLAWNYLQQSPRQFRVEITKLKPLPDTVEAQPLNCAH